ncbi:MAG: hypothetical protein IAG10_30795 [Planctomycetaceae bacterium]|nr:hypothetical protein [Planctomycetaceae bacterium]
MSEVVRKLLGKSVVVSLRLAGVIPVKWILISADDRVLVVEQLKGTRRVPVHIPIESVLFFVEDHDEHH